MRYLRWILFLFLLLPIVLIALLFPLPSPRPFPFSSVQLEAGGGSHEAVEEKVYSSSLGISALKNYYNFQLRFFCRREWHWGEIPTEKTITSCTNRLDGDHTFSVILELLSDGKVLVTQEDVWQDL
jgi:hypothetical protein